MEEIFSEINELSIPDRLAILTGVLNEILKEINKTIQEIKKGGY